jgi:hypothetical protein
MAFLSAMAAVLLLEGDEGEAFVVPAAVCPEQRGGLGGGDAGRGILYGTETIREERLGGMESSGEVSGRSKGEARVKESYDDAGEGCVGPHTPPAAWKRWDNLQ